MSQNLHSLRKKTANDIGEALANKLLVAVDTLVRSGGNGAGNGNGLNQAKQGYRKGLRREHSNGIHAEQWT